MATNDFYKEESPKNFEQKCPVVLVLDTSGSMGGDPIKELNLGLQKFKEDCENDIVTANRLEVSIVTFNGEVKVISTFKLLADQEMPELSAGSSTKLVDGVNRAIQVLETRKAWYKETGQTYYRPYIILITDGYPDADQDTDVLAKTIANGVENKHYNFWSFGVMGADMQMLEKITTGFKPLPIKGIEFSKFFKWLSSSLGAITKSKEGDTLQLAPKTEGENPFQIPIQV